MTNPLGLSPLEVASGVVLGEDPAAPELPLDPAPRLEQALESAVRRALERPPCVVTFSGGRDSSAVLALAVDLARREGLPLPVPLTYRFPASTKSEESHWQERVIQHLALEEWARESFEAELDCLGPIAQEGLRRHGLLWPANVHSVVPALRAAAGGSVLMGTGGDELLHPGRHAHLSAVLAGRERPQPRDLARAVFAIAPRALRRRRRRGEATWIDCPWLRPEPRDRLTAAFAAVAAGEPVRRGPWVRWIWHMRAIQLTIASMETLAQGMGSQLVSPFLDRRVVAAYGPWAANAPPTDRTDAFRRLFGRLLPEDVVGRRTKATFDGAFWCRHSETFAGSLTLAEVDSELVDGARALDFWAAGGTETAGPIPSSTLLQALWLARELEIERAEQGDSGIAERVPVATATER